MSAIETRSSADYRAAGRRLNTEKAYTAAVKHYRQVWGGVLPTTAADIAAYLANYAPTLAPSTLHLRLSGLRSWHLSHGFSDPTSANIVSEVMRGIRHEHNRAPKKAEPLLLDDIIIIAAHLERRHADAVAAGSVKNALSSARDKALLLIGFWRGYRCSDLARIEIQNISFESDKVEIFLPTSKADRSNAGDTQWAPRMDNKLICPVKALEDYVWLFAKKSGPLFVSISRRGEVGETGLSAKSVTSLLRKMIVASGAPLSAASFSSHSLRRGFSTWSVRAIGWDMNALASYVGWSSVQTAAEYVQADPAAIASKFNHAVSSANLREVGRDNMIGIVAQK